MNEKAVQNRYHCCATCEHFSHRDEGGKKVPYCSRLGYDTSPKWQFNCWEPKPRVRKKMSKGV